MSYDIQYSDTFKRSAKALAKKYPSFKQDLSNFVIELAKVPDLGTPLGHNMYKVRMVITSKNRGKSGGERKYTTKVIFRRSTKIRY